MGGLAHHVNVTATTTSMSKRQSRQPPIGQIIPPRLPAIGTIAGQDQNPVPMATNVALAIAHRRTKAMFALQVKSDKYSV